MSGIYFDHNASTPIAPEVLDAMQPYLLGHHGNPSSRHWASRGARPALDEARAQVASLLGADPDEIVFTSGGSESNNHAIKGVVLRHLREHPGSRPHLVISAVEHPAVKAPCRWLEAFGARVSEVGVDRHGMVSPSDMARSITPDTVLVSIMHAQNEVGTIQPIADIAAEARARGALVHCDAAQSAGKIPTRVDALGVDLLSLAGHKLYAPKGVGALYVRRGVSIDPLIHGADHESGRRAGTESVALAVALGAACALAQSSPHDVAALRDALWNALRDAFGERVVLNGHPSARLPNTLNVSFVGHDGSALLSRLETLAASTGSACHGGAVSPVLTAMGIDAARARGAVRFSLGRSTGADEVARIVQCLREVL